MFLKLKTIHKCFIRPQKGKAQCYATFTNNFEVTMQVKHVIGKAYLHILPIYNEYMCLDLLFVFKWK